MVIFPFKERKKMDLVNYMYSFFSFSKVVNKTTSSTLTSHASSSQYHVSTSEMKAQALKRDLNEIKNSMSEINNLASMSTLQKR